MKKSKKECSKCHKPCTLVDTIIRIAKNKDVKGCKKLEKLVFEMNNKKNIKK